MFSGWSEEMWLLCSLLSTCPHITIWTGKIFLFFCYEFATWSKLGDPLCPFNCIVLQCWKFCWNNHSIWRIWYGNNVFQTPLLCSIAQNARKENFYVKSWGNDKFDKMSLNDLISYGHTAKWTIGVFTKR